MEPWKRHSSFRIQDKLAEPDCPRPFGGGFLIQLVLNDGDTTTLLPFKNHHSLRARSSVG